MEGMGAPIGAGVSITFEGQSYVLSGPTLEDFGVMHNELVKIKRREKMQLVTEMYQAVKDGILPHEVWQEQCTLARKEAESIRSVQPSEVEEWGSTQQGFAFLMWLCFEHKYPGQLSRERIEKAVFDPANAEQIAEWSEAIAIASGATAENPTQPETAGQ